MQIATSASPVEMAAGVVAGTLTPPLPALFDDLTAEFDFPAFNYSLTAPVAELSAADDFQRITVKPVVDTEVILVCRLNGEGATNGAEPRPEVIIDFEAARPSARAAFVIATLKALFGLSETVSWRLPILQLDAEIRPAVPLPEIGPSLRRRMMAERVMEIERAFHRELVVPVALSRADEDQITFVYRALTDRSVVRPFFVEGAFRVRADEAARAQLEACRQSGVFRLELAQWCEEMLGDKLPLGPAVVTVEKATIINNEEVKRELERLDGREFQVAVRRLAGEAKYEFPEAPRIPGTKWDDLIEELMALRWQMSEAFFQAVNALAAGSLADLSEEERAELTARPELDEEAFLFDDAEGEV